MLTRRRRAAVVAWALVASLVLHPSSALADDGGGACNGPDCGAWGTQPGSGGDHGGTGGGGSDDGGSDGCHFASITVPCDGGDLGWWSSPCYLKPMAAPNPDPANGEGFWYWATCFAPNASLSVGIPMWFAAAQGPSPEELARRALATITLKGPAIGIGTAGLVFTPVWLWTTVTPNTWGPISASASAGGLTVTITARTEQIVWDMGNGDSVTCTAPGTKQGAGEADRPSPTCGYDGYPQPSRTQRGGAYTVTGTSAWRVTWAGGGQTGVIDQTRTSSTTVRIDEAQVVNR
ncbi:hypothetical protein [Actinoplanes sp. L3-i22]|uniref:hypothetical protein n=1 Tax=Actinoplanes sp. L3-i22 TaxID=2836373 RepID=UPI001C73F27B|nr:hypothetical protein [Actinoplanes sp. L3-i22]BCY10930.1 hypothetical protein L3i22_060180 [Actinoplanes sp. L3-i22]